MPVLDPLAKEQELLLIRARTYIIQYLFDLIAGRMRPGAAVALPLRILRSPVTLCSGADAVVARAV